MYGHFFILYILISTGQNNYVVLFLHKYICFNNFTHILAFYFHKSY